MAFQPTQRDIELGDALKRARGAAGVNQHQVGERLSISQAKVSRYETARQEIPRRDLDDLLELYQPPPELRAKIELLATPPDPEDAEDASPNRDFMELKRAEKDAVEVRSASGEVIPRPFQSDQYMLLQYEKAGHRISSARLLNEKRQRQQLLTRDNPPRYFQLLSESAIYRVPGGARVLVQEQARYLLRLIEEHPRLSLQVVRFDADLAHFDNMTLLRFADRHRNIVYLPNSRYGRLVKDQKIVLEREGYWNTMQRAALSLEGTKKFLQQVVNR